jgi:hypothetical protein
VMCGGVANEHRLGKVSAFLRKKTFSGYDVSCIVEEQ